MRLLLNHLLVFTMLKDLCHITSCVESTIYKAICTSLLPTIFPWMMARAACTHRHHCNNPWAEA